MLPDQDKQLTDKLLSWFRNSESSSTDYRDRITRNLNYYSGYGHWSYKDIIRAQSEDPPRALITVNNIFKFLNMLSGFERQSRQDLRAYPVGRGSDPLLADILSVLMKQIDAETFGTFARSDLYVNGQIADRSFIRWKLKFRRFRPVIEQEIIDSRLIYEDPEGNTYDEKSHRYIAVSNWMWEEEVLQRFASNEMEARVIKENFDRSAVRDDRLFFQMHGEHRKVRVIEFQYKEFEKTITAMNPVTQEIVDRIDENTAMALREQGWFVMFDADAKTKIAKLSGDFLLETMDHPFVSNGGFDITRYSPYFAMGQDVSMVDQLTSQQDELNANRSAMRDLIARAPKGTVLYTKFSGLSPTDVKNLSSLGGAYEVNDLSQIKVMDTSAYYTALGAFAQLSDRAAKEFQEVTGVTDVLLGQLKSSTSGIVFERAVSQAVIGMETALDNYRRTTKLHFKKLLEIVQKFFPSDKIMRVTDDQYPFLTKKGNGQTAYMQTSPAEVELLNQYMEVIEKIKVDPEVGSYDVVMEFGRNAVSQMNYNLSLAIEMLRMSPEMATEVSDLVVDMTQFPNKAVWIERIRQMKERMGQISAMQEMDNARMQEAQLETQAANQEVMEATAFEKQAKVFQESEKNGKGK